LPLFILIFALFPPSDINYFIYHRENEKKDMLKKEYHEKSSSEQGGFFLFKLSQNGYPGGSREKKRFFFSSPQPLRQHWLKEWLCNREHCRSWWGYGLTTFSIIAISII
jgi:CRISPR/Cas system endoribonuclease Cas6 (RAMP superfamily)